MAINEQKTGAFAPVLFSIVVVTYNSAATIVPCLTSVFATAEAGVEIVVVDNASRDNTVALVRQLQSSVSNCSLQLITNNTNNGFSVASNQGISTTSAPYLVLLNPDTVVTPFWLINLQQHLADPLVAAVGPVSNFAAQRQSVVWHWHGPLPQGVSPVQAAEYLYATNQGKAEETKLLIGFCLMVRRVLLEQLGGLDGRLFLGADDLELSWRLRVHGYRLLIATDCFVYHEGQHSFKTESSSTTGRLVQESSNELYARLKECYGQGRVPTPQELWGIDWFTPDNACFNPAVSLHQVLSLPKGSSLSAPLFSIIILTWNQLEYTKECLEALRRHTPEHHEIIIVDNGSSDGTVAWLQACAADDPRYRLILNADNRGFAAGCNQGLELAKGDWLLLLNNDVVVTPGWLGGLFDCHRATSNAGIVGPLTNNASGIQGIGPAPYCDNAGLELFAQKFRVEHRHRRVFLRRLVGFCMLFSRQLHQQIGGLDERFGTGNYEDDDICLRAAIAGYRNIVAADTYIHHHGSVSFQGGGVDYRTALTGNWALFRKKWSEPVHNPQYAQLISICRLREEAETLMLQQRPDEAVQLLHQASTSFPEERLLQELHRQLLCVTGQYEASARLGYRVAEAYCLLDNGQIGQAEQLLRLVMAEEPGCGESLLVLSHLMRRCGEYEYADALLLRSFMLSPVIVSEFLLKAEGLYTMSGLKQLVCEASQLNPDSKALGKLLVLTADTAEQVAEAAETYLLRFGVEHELVIKGLEARKQIGYHRRAHYEIPTVSLCMIVRDEERYLAHCLASCRPLVSQMLVVDTGSNDRTPYIAELFGAQVVRYPWQNDFSSARNRGLELATGRWILVMDADERLSPRDYQLFCQTLEQATVCAFSISTRNYCSTQGRDAFTPLDGDYPEEEAGIGWTSSDKIRLFPNYPEIRFEGLVHELVEGAVARVGLDVRKHPVPIHHYGGLEKERLERKRRMYYQLGEQKLRNEQDRTAKALYELAVQAGELEQYEQAQMLWLEFLQQEPVFAPGWFNLGYVLLRDGKIEEALAATERALQLKEEYLAARINQSICHFVLYPMQGQMAELLREQSKMPTEPTLRILVALAYCLNGQLEKGITDLRQLYDTGTNPIVFIQELSRLFDKHGKTETAAVLTALSTVINSGLHQV